MSLHSSVSIGVALFPDDGADLSVLLRKADIAMYMAKTSGNGYCFCDDAEDANGATRLQTVEELRTALTSDELVGALVASPRDPSAVEGEAQCRRSRSRVDPSSGPGEAGTA